jgi:hypothetical protein
MTDRRRVVHIRVSDGSKQTVNIALPLGLAKRALIGGIADQLSSQSGIDLDEILNGIEGSADGPIVDVIDEKSGDHIQLSVESVGAGPAAAVR